MSSSDVAISVRGLSKAYTIRHQDEEHITLAEQALTRLRHPLRRVEKETFWALDDVSFDVQRGEVLGVIGRNGAGKSTLLKVLSRITVPTKGEVHLHGRVGSLLEVGTGFHPELTGRENIYLNGSILGMRTSEIDRQFDAIVDFAGVERFLDTPVKRYSSGMYVRLAFAVAAHLETEILLLDEVLSVGDVAFQARCRERIRAAARDGRSTLIVSHQLGSLAETCAGALLFDSGHLKIQSDVDTVLSAYAGLDADSSRSPTQWVRRAGTGEVRLRGFHPSLDLFDPSSSKRFEFEVELAADHAVEFWIAVVLRDATQSAVAHCDSSTVGRWYCAAPNDEPVRGAFSFDTPWLHPGTYSVDVYLCNPGGVIDAVEPATVFVVSARMPYASPPGPEVLARDGYLPDYSFTVETAR
jgi:lipopolysaccharide transport system ATP-binding protein